MLRVVIVDGDAEVRAGLRRTLAGTATAVLVGEFASVREAKLDTAARRPDLLVLEVPDVDDDAGPAVKAVEHFVQALPETAIFASGRARSGDVLMRLMRAGAMEYLQHPIQPSDFIAAVDKVARVRRGVTPARQTGRIVAVYSPKGGVGVTTVAVNVAVALARTPGVSALLIDLDTRQSDAATLLSVVSPYCALDAFENIHRLDEMYLRGLLVKHSSGLWVLPGPTRIERSVLTAEQTRAGLEIMRSHFDHVVLDVRHDLDPATAAALDAADEILLLTALNVGALRMTAAAVAALRLLAVNPQKLRVVVMREGARDEVTLKQAREALGVDIAWTIPNDYGPTVAAINSGRPVVIGAPRARATKSLVDLAATVARAAPATPATRRRPSLMTVFRTRAGLMRAS